MDFIPFVYGNKEQALKDFNKIPNARKNLAKKHVYCFDCPLNDAVILKHFPFYCNCQIGYLALTGQLTAERLVDLQDIPPNHHSLFIDCPNRRRQLIQFFDKCQLNKIMDVE